MASGSKGDSFLKEGESALRRSTIFGFGKAQKFEDAAEAFVKAGNAFKLSSLWESAGCFRFEIEAFRKPFVVHEYFYTDRKRLPKGGRLQ
jgi:hypothetical protein